MDKYNIIDNIDFSYTQWFPYHTINIIRLYHYDKKIYYGRKMCEINSTTLFNQKTIEINSLFSYKHPIIEPLQSYKRRYTQNSQILSPDFDEISQLNETSILPQKFKDYTNTTDWTADSSEIHEEAYKQKIDESNEYQIEHREQYEEQFQQEYDNLKDKMLQTVFKTWHPNGTITNSFYLYYDTETNTEKEYTKEELEQFLFSKKINQFYDLKIEKIGQLQY